MGDPVSWLMIEPGWRVVDSAGGAVGRVEAVTGDSGADIFDGLAVASDMLGHPKYVPAEQVGTIEDGVVHLTLDAAGVAALTEYEEPPESIEIESEGTSRLQRVEGKFVKPKVQEHRETLVRRIAAWFGLAGRR